MSSSGLLIPKLCRANLAILSQKIGLIDALVSRHDATKAAEMYRLASPLVGASIGQHFRHSLDHVELAALIGDAATKENKFSPDDDGRIAEIHYDLRVRGGTSETDMNVARKRIEDVSNVLDRLRRESEESSGSASEKSDEEQSLPVLAHFVLSADEGEEVGLPSTLGRELGFAAHHAIHHMAMIKIIATNDAGLADGDLPADFGRAPSTVQHDRMAL